MTSLGGWPFNGYSPKQSILNYRGGNDALTRNVLRRGWNTGFATGIFNTRNRMITPFRAVNNSGDFLSRKNYICGGPNPISKALHGHSHILGGMLRACDATGVPASNCNPKYVYDSSLYTRYKRERANNVNYNDKSFGGDQSNASYVNLMAVRRR